MSVKIGAPSLKSYTAFTVIVTVGVASPTPEETTRTLKDSEVGEVIALSSACFGTTA